MRTIKFDENRVTMKPVKGETGLTEIWTRYRPAEGEEKVQFFMYNGLSYYLTTVKQ
jgi:hypothetical protein